MLHELRNLTRVVQKFISLEDLLPATRQPRSFSAVRLLSNASSLHRRCLHARKVLWRVLRSRHGTRLIAKLRSGRNGETATNHVPSKLSARTPCARNRCGITKSRNRPSHLAWMPRINAYREYKVNKHIVALTVTYSCIGVKMCILKLR